ncbi:Pentatricopeptide repeat-containing protein At2g32630 [Linum perenne]
MASQRLLQAYKRVIPVRPCSTSDEEMAKMVAQQLKKSGLRAVKAMPSLNPNLNSEVTCLVLSNPDINPRSCLSFFNFLQSDQSISQKPNVEATIILLLRLFKDRKFLDMRNVLTRIVLGDVRFTVTNLMPLVSAKFDEPIFAEKLCDLLFRVYADARMFTEGLEVFCYMINNGLKVDERSCIVYLLASKRCDEMEMCSGLFRRMIKANVEITVYSLTIVIDGLCRRGSVARAKELMVEMSVKGIRPNVITYNTILNGYVKRKDPVGVEEILKLMKTDNVAYNAATYTMLIEYFGDSGEAEEAERAFALFDELSEKGLAPNTHTYGALIEGVCKVGQMEATTILLSKMQGQGLDMNQRIFNTLIDGYCKLGMIDEALRVNDRMEAEGFKADNYTHNIIASGFCKANKLEDAKSWLFAMIEKGATPNPVNFTTLINIYCKEGNILEAKKLFQDMKKKSVRPTLITYNAMMDGCCKQGKLSEAYKLKDEMVDMGILSDIYTYTSLIHGECIAGNVDKALKLFNEARESGLAINVVTYTAIISGLSKEGQSEEAFKLYDEAMEAGLTPDDRLYASLVGSLHEV